MQFRQGLTERSSQQSLQQVSAQHHQSKSLIMSPQQVHQFLSSRNQEQSINNQYITLSANGFTSENSSQLQSKRSRLVQPEILKAKNKNLFTIEDLGKESVQFQQNKNHKVFKQQFQNPTKKEKKNQPLQKQQQMQQQQCPHNSIKVNNLINQQYDSSNKENMNPQIRYPSKDNKHQHKQHSQSQQYQDFNFIPMLSKKSMEMAEKMEEAIVRLTASSFRTDAKIMALRQQQEREITFKPKINKKSMVLAQKLDMHHNHIQNNESNYSFFSISEEETDNYSPEQEWKNFKGSNNDCYQEFEIQQFENDLNSFEKQLIPPIKTTTQQMEGSEQQQYHPSQKCSEQSEIPRWQSLYQKHKIKQSKREIQAQLNKQIIESDPELTFKPKLHLNKKYQQQTSLDIAQRSQLWEQNRLNKIQNSISSAASASSVTAKNKGVNKTQNSVNYSEGSSHPQQNQSFKSSSTQFDSPNLEIAHNSSRNQMMNLEKQQQQDQLENKSAEFHKTSSLESHKKEFLSDYNKNGLKEYFRKIEASKKERQAEEQLLQCEDQQYMSQWRNKVTLPKEFSFMKKQNEQFQLSSMQDQTAYQLKNLYNNSECESNREQSMIINKRRSISSNQLSSARSLSPHKSRNQSIEKVKLFLHEQLLEMKL